MGYFSSFRTRNLLMNSVSAPEVHQRRVEFKGEPSTVRIYVQVFFLLLNRGYEGASGGGRTRIGTRSASAGGELHASGKSALTLGDGGLEVHVNALVHLLLARLSFLHSANFLLAVDALMFGLGLMDSRGARDSAHFLGIVEVDEILRCQFLRLVSFFIVIFITVDCRALSWGRSGEMSSGRTDWSVFAHLA